MLSYLRSVLIGTGLLLVACDQPLPQVQMSLPAPEVAVIQAQADAVPVTRELVGRLAATRLAQVRARVAGIILKRVYTEGTDVKAGDFT